MGKKIFFTLVALIPAVVVVAFALAPHIKETGKAASVKAATRADKNQPQMLKKKPKGKASKNSPNILLIVTDDQPDGTMGEMPRVQKFFRAGTNYLNAYASTSLCCPARASIMSGQYVHNHGVQTNGRQETHSFDHSQSVQWTLQEAGYKTGLFGKFMNNWYKEKKVPGWDLYDTNENGEMSTDKKITKDALSFIKQSKDPWFVYLGLHAPHWPWTEGQAKERSHVPKSFFEKDLSDKPPYVRRLSNEQDKKPSSSIIEQRSISQELNDLDTILGSFFASLKKKKETKNTLVFFLSDQGYMWGQNGGIRGKKLPYNSALQIPLMVRWPNGKSNAKDRRLASSVDIAPTIYKAVGIEPGYTVDGISLIGKKKRRWAFAEMSRTWETEPWSARITKNNVFIHTAGRTPWDEFYDLKKDPWQMESDPRKISEKMKKQLSRARKCIGKSCP